MSLEGTTRQHMHMGLIRICLLFQKGTNRAKADLKEGRQGRRMKERKGGTEKEKGGREGGREGVEFSRP